MVQEPFERYVMHNMSPIKAMKHSDQLSRAFKCRRFSSVIEFIVVYLLCFLLSAIISLACFRRSYDLLINHLSFKFQYQSSQRLNISIIHFKYSRHQLAKFQLAKFITSSILLVRCLSEDHREASPNIRNSGSTVPAEYLHDVGSRHW